MNSDAILGWDIGGAHVKVAVLRAARLFEVKQFPCALWQGIAQLEKTVDRILKQYEQPKGAHALTMTGELADCFTDRSSGVEQILGVFSRRIDAHRLHVFVGKEGLVSFQDLNSDDYRKIASANWLASAVCTAAAVEHGVLIDIGSTTSDVLLLDSGAVRNIGDSDYARLCSGELVYSGVVRTPIAAIAKSVVFDGNLVPLMAEHFATSADIYRLTGELAPEYDQWPAADGAEKTPHASARRLARMIGLDFDAAPITSWISLAKQIKEIQMREIQDAAQRQLSRLNRGKPVIIGAGIGRFLARQISVRIDSQYQDFGSVLPNAGKIPGVAECAPAAALAHLLGSRAGS